jgi:hypothetical protein
MDVLRVVRPQAGPCLSGAVKQNGLVVQSIQFGLPKHTFYKATVYTMLDVLKLSATVCAQVLQANESFSQGFDKPMGLGVKKKVRAFKTLHLMIESQPLWGAAACTPAPVSTKCILRVAPYGVQWPRGRRSPLPCLPCLHVATSDLLCIMTPIGRHGWRLCSVKVAGSLNKVWCGTM